MNSTWEDRRKLEERLGEQLLTQSMIDDMDEGELALTLLEALHEALLTQLNIVVVDCSSDDEYRFMLVKADEDESL